MFFKKTGRKKNQLISRKRGSFRMTFKLVRKTIFEKTHNFRVIIWVFFVFFLDIIKVYTEKVISFCFVFLMMLHI